MIGRSQGKTEISRCLGAPEVKRRVALDKRKGSVKQKVSLSMPGHRSVGQVATKRTHEK
jgi:hypothetical protein